MVDARRFEGVENRLTVGFGHRAPRSDIPVSDPGSERHDRARECHIAHRGLTGIACVNRIFTDLAVIDVTKDGLRVIESVPGLAFEELQRLTGVELLPLGQRDEG